MDKWNLSNFINMPMIHVIGSFCFLLSGCSKLKLGSIVVNIRINFVDIVLYEYLVHDDSLFLLLSAYITKINVWRCSSKRIARNTVCFFSGRISIAHK